MYDSLFNEFLKSSDSLRVYKADRLLFTSEKDGVLPLVEFLNDSQLSHQEVVVFDKVMGNAAALLCVKANCLKIYSPLGSQLAIKTLEEYGIEYHLTEIVPYIQKSDREEMCPMEKLSINKNPEEFYKVLQDFLNKKATQTPRPS